MDLRQMSMQSQKEKNEDKSVQEGERSCGSDDQKSRAYYYDDAHGYEDFDPEEADDEDESDETVR